MVKEKFTLLSKYDKLPLSILLIAPNEGAKGIVQLVHGMAERKERYEELMSFLAQNGYVCVCHDHRGHGESLKRIGASWEITTAKPSLRTPFWLVNI